MPNTLGVQTLPERLRWARETAGLTTRQLATAAKVAAGYPSAIECNQFKNPTAAALQRLAEALGISFEWLVLGTGRRPTITALRRRGKTLKQGLAA